LDRKHNPRRPFDLQGHRGARGLKPENTLPSFEVALDFGVSSVETDVHLTADGVPILAHDPLLDGRLLSTLTLAEVRAYRLDRNPDPGRFPRQENSPTALAQEFARQRDMDIYAAPTLCDLLEFVQVYGSAEGEKAGKSETQRTAARRVRYDLELKRVPFHPEAIGDGFDGHNPGRLEQQVVTAVRTAGVVERTAVRSFDHRSIRAVGILEPRITLALLMAGTAVLDPVGMLQNARAQMYCPEYTFLDSKIVAALHAAGMRVLPWTVNEMHEWARLLEWGVDGITTDYPDRLAAWLVERGVSF
jgi:glycerophosphoryl diester phosphodiesterase